MSVVNSQQLLWTPDPSDCARKGLENTKPVAAVGGERRVERGVERRVERGGERGGERGRRERWREG